MKYLRAFIGFLALTLLVHVAYAQYLPFPVINAGSGAPIGTPVGIGSLNKSSGSSTTATFSTTGNIVSGDTVVVAISSLIAGTVSSVSDGTNTYARAINVVPPGNALLEVWYKSNASAVGSGATVTVTFSVATIYCSCAVVRVPNAAASSLDKTAGSLSLPVTTPTLTFPNEVVFGTVGGYNFTGTVEDAAFTNLYFIPNAGQVSLNVGYKSVSSTTAVAYNPTVVGAGGSLAYAATTFH